MIGITAASVALNILAGLVWAACAVDRICTEAIACSRHVYYERSGFMLTIERLTGWTFVGMVLMWLAIARYTYGDWIIEAARHWLLALLTG